MAHEVYTTPAYVLEARPIGEASKLFVLFSRDHGVIRGIAQGIRFNKSKLRYSLSEFSRPVISLVRGREHWRIVGALPSNEGAVTPEDQDGFKLYVRVLLLIKQLAPLEEENLELFSEVEQAFLYLKQKNAGDLADFEATLVLRVLKNLGYLGDIPTLAKFTNSFVWAPAILEEMSPLREQAVRAINSSLTESHLL